MANYVIGIDGGGTKTVAIAYSETGQQFAIHTAGASNLANGYDSSVAHIEACLQAVKQPGTLSRVSLGIAGVQSGHYASNLLAHLTSQYPGVEIRLTNDVIFAHQALFGGGNGLLVSAGTGSIAIYKTQTKYEMLGGWGHLLGDEGSGYDIANRLYRYCTYCDDYQITSPLVQQFYQANDYHNSRDFVPFIYQSVKKEIAQTAIFVAMAAKNGDLEARKIVSDCAHAFADYIIGALQARQITKIPVQFFGSVILANQQYYEIISVRFKQAGFEVLAKPDADFQVTTAVLVDVR